MQELALQSSATPSLALFMAPSSAFCVTIYNERLAVVQRTLVSLVHSVSQYIESGIDRGHTVCLCLLLDGATNTDNDLLCWLVDAKLMECGESISLGGEDLHLTLHTGSELLRRLGQVEDHPALSDCQVRVVVCVKSANRGKLHSHSLFFGDICRWIGPTFCLQVDAGTVVSKESYSVLICRMRAEPEIGALAPCIMAPHPDRSAFFLTTWQYMDFLQQKSLGWPFEAASGHLSVVPGQFCVLRWAALQSPPELDTSEPRSWSAPVPDPVDLYLRGLLCESALEKTMYLAEDRVIGNEITLQPGPRWKLDYCQDSFALTDACLTLPELMRQRRRWNNSSLACRLWLLRRVPSTLMRQDRNRLEKTSYSFAMLAQVMLALLEFGAPAIFVASILVIVRVFDATEGGWLAVGAKIFVLAGLISVIAFQAVSRLDNSRAVQMVCAAMRTAAGIVASFAAVVLLFVVLPPASLLLVTLPRVLACLAIAFVDWRNLSKALLRQSSYMLADAFLTPLLTSYSIFNLHDISWGTKGLTAAPGKLALKRRMHVWRAQIVAAWLVFNTGLVAAALTCPGWTSNYFNPVFEVSCAAMALVAGVAAVSLLRRSIKTRLKL